MAIIIVSVPLGGDFQSITERGKSELFAWAHGNIQDYILFAVAYLCSLMGLETPQGYSLLILLILFKLGKNFGITFLILNLIFFTYIGITGYHRNYLALLLLVWGFFGKNLLLILISVFTHKSALLYLFILLFSKIFHYRVYSSRNNLTIFFNFCLAILLIAFLTYLASTNYNYLGPVKHYFEFYIVNESDKSEGAIFRYLSALITVFFFYIFHKDWKKFYNFDKSSVNRRETAELSIWLCLALSLILLITGFTVAPDRITLFTLILLSFLVSELDKNPYAKVHLFTIALPSLILIICWLFLSDKAYSFWGGKYLSLLFNDDEADSYIFIQNYLNYFIKIY